MNLIESFNVPRLKKMFSLKYILFILALFSGIVGYTYLINYIPNGKNVFTINWQSSERLNFYSGTNGGFYIKIGQLLQNKSKLRRYNVRVSNVTTEGSPDNLRSVLRKTKSIGIVQIDDAKNIIENYDFVNVISPLYLERVHILYNCSLLKNEADKKKVITIGSYDSNTMLLKFLNKAKIHRPPVGSSAYFVAEHMLKYIKNIKKGGQEIDITLDFYEAEKDTRNFEERLELLKDGKIHLDFFTAGAPLNSITRALKDPNIKLMSISPIFINDVIKSSNLDIVQCDFNGLYEDQGKNISTYGSYATLIASKDVDNSTALEVLKILDEHKSSIPEAQLAKNFQLDEIPFYENYRIAHTEEKMSKLKNLLLFISSVAVSTFLVYFFIFNLISSYYKSTLTKRLIELDNAFLMNQPSALKKEDIIQFDDSYVKVNETVKAIFKVDEVNLDIKKYYERSRLNDTGFRSLIEQSNALKEEFNHVLEKFVLLIPEEKFKQELRPAMQKLLDYGVPNMGLYQRIIKWIE
ncbi:TAXI family TRAP transporter solute-binding subunit [Labilibacter marinus]|uniref:TAXI family TRAP transporter solute-binding subunit n=1 Tax=Labilibacter marinus TaxID=1477105 RepID=UPI00094FBC62|nr:TAXI family TRAP transporter solute-binding subunit [Labilibacter marinus]